MVGLRPTYGRVSRYGAMALSWTMDKIGPMCRSVEDCALVFNAIYGPDGRDDTVVDAPFEWNPDLPLSKLWVGYVKAEFEAQPGHSAFAKQYAAGQPQVVWTRLVADLETPVSAMLKLSDGRPMSCLL